jgi:hypothetical protein
MKELADNLSSIVKRYYAKLQQVTEAESGKPLSEGKWSRKQILGHLIDSASNNHQRFVRAQLSAHIELPEYTQNDWVRINGYEREPWSELIQFWRLYTLHLAHILAGMPDDVLTHTISLSNNPPKTIKFVAEDYVRHLVHHLEQMKLEA